jgi:hypothetical protein
MEFTFGIVTDGNNDDFIKEIIKSIHKQNIPKFEIIIVGNSNISSEKIRVIAFDETIKKGWITKKKNIINQEALYENIVHLHDYIKLDDKWYEGFLKYGNNFDICVTKIINNNGRRFRDFTLLPGNQPFSERCLLPYDFEQNVYINKIMYISCAYYIIKKKISLKYPWNEELSWGMADDIEFCQRLSNDNILFKCNKFSTVSLLKNKDQCNWEREILPAELDILENMESITIEKFAIDQRNNIKNHIFINFNIEI